MFCSCKDLPVCLHSTWPLKAHRTRQLLWVDFLLHVILFITARGEDLCHSGLLQWCVPVLWLWIMQYSNSLEYNIWLWQHCRNMWHFISSTNSVQNPPTAMLFTAWGPHRDWSVVFMMKFIEKKKNMVGKVEPAPAPHLHTHTYLHLNLQFKTNVSVVVFTGSLYRDRRQQVEDSAKIIQNYHAQGFSPAIPPPQNVTASPE